MMSLLFSGQGHVINNVMTTHVLLISAGTNNLRMTSVTTMQFFLEINREGDKITLILKGHIIKRILHLWSFHMKFIKLTKGLFDKFHLN